jgi:hypothetical protein
MSKRQRRKEFMRRQHELETGKPWKSQFEDSSSISVSPQTNKYTWRSVSSAEAKQMNRSKGRGTISKKTRRTRKKISQKHHN